MSNTIHFVGGEKGGVGKSFFTKILVSYYIQRLKQDVMIFECDDVNRDIERVYSKQGMAIETIVFSSAEKDLTLPNLLLESAGERDLIVNLPAGVHKLVGEWFKVGRVVKLSKRMGLDFYLWYVCDGDRTNLRLFNESVESVPIKHIFVKNMVKFNEREWESAFALMEAEGEGIKLEGVSVVQIEKLGYWEAKALSQNYLSFETIANFRGERFGAIEEGTVELFLEDCLDELEKVYASGGVSGGVLRDMEASAELERRYEELHGGGGMEARVERRLEHSGTTPKGQEEEVMPESKGIKDKEAAAIVAQAKALGKKMSGWGKEEDKGAAEEEEDKDEGNEGDEYDEGTEGSAGSEAVYDDEEGVLDLSETEREGKAYKHHLFPGEIFVTLEELLRRAQKIGYEVKGSAKDEGSAEYKIGYRHSIYPKIIFKSEEELTKRAIEDGYKVSRTRSGRMAINGEEIIAVPKL